MLLIPLLFSFEMNLSNFYIIQSIHKNCIEKWNKWKKPSNRVLESGELWKWFHLLFLSGKKCIKGQRREQSATGGEQKTHTAFNQRHPNRQASAVTQLSLGLLSTVTLTLSQQNGLKHLTPTLKLKGTKLDCRVQTFYSDGELKKFR